LCFYHKKPRFLAFIDDLKDKKLREAKELQTFECNGFRSRTKIVCRGVAKAFLAFVFGDKTETETTP